MLIAYHGTTRTFEKFHPSGRGSFGQESLARIFAEDQGGRVLKCRLHLENPYIYYATDNYDFDLDSYAVDLVQRLYGPSMARGLIEASRFSDGLFGAEIQTMLKEMGHDGIIVIYRLDGCFEYVAFDPESVEILDGNCAFDHEADEQIQWLNHRQHDVNNPVPHMMSAVTNAANYLRIKQASLDLSNPEGKRSLQVLSNLLLLLAVDVEKKGFEPSFITLVGRSAHDLLQEWWAVTTSASDCVAVGVMNDLRIALCAMEYGCEAAGNRLPIKIKNADQLIAA